MVMIGKDLSSHPLRFGALGAAYITPKVLIQAARRTGCAEVVAIAARDPVRARSFAKENGISRVHQTYEKLIEDENVEAIYVALPVSFHYEWTLKALRAGKHVLCEKAFSLNGREALAMEEIAEESELVLLEAFHYRYHPVMQRLIQIIRSGQLGSIHHIEGEFSAPAAGRSAVYTDLALGGGATLHLGCYALHWLRHLMPEEPEIVGAEATLDKNGVDLSLFAEVRYPNGATGVWGGLMGAPNRTMQLRVTGSEGQLTATNPLVPHMGHSIELDVAGTQTIETLTRRPSYDYQLEAFVEAVTTGIQQPTNARDAVIQMRLIDSAFRMAGLPQRGEEIAK